MEIYDMKYVRKKEITKIKAQGFYDKNWNIRENSTQSKQKERNNEENT